MTTKGRRRGGGPTKLSDAATYELLELHYRYGWSLNRLVAKFGVTLGTVQAATKGRTHQNIYELYMGNQELRAA